MCEHSAYEEIDQWTEDDGTVIVICVCHRCAETWAQVYEDDRTYIHQEGQDHDH